MASAKAGSLTWRSSSTSSTRAPSTVARMASNRAASASGDQNGIPSASIMDTPRSGRNSATGPVASLSFAAMIRPSSAHSPGVVRIRVTCGLCL